MGKLFEILKALGNTELLVTIIIILIFFIILLGSIIVAILKKISKNVVDNINKVIETRKTEISIVKQSIELLTKDIEEIKNKVELNNNTTTLLAYHQCMNEAMKWQEKGEIPVGAKMHFDKVWQQYEKLGDGHGDDPKTMIDQLRIIN